LSSTRIPPASSIRLQSRALFRNRRVLSVVGVVEYGDAVRRRRQGSTACGLATVPRSGFNTNPTRQRGPPSLTRRVRGIGLETAFKPPAAEPDNTLQPALPAKAFDCSKVAASDSRYANSPEKTPFSCGPARRAIPTAAVRPSGKPVGQGARA